jgi:hypothetical protein
MPAAGPEPDPKWNLKYHKMIQCSSKISIHTRIGPLPRYYHIASNMLNAV